MRFYEKLNLLMGLQNIPNNKLAKALSVDPSLISRWRNGTRDLAKNSEYIVGIAEYFAKHSCDKNGLYEILDLSVHECKIEDSQLSKIIWEWLSDDYAINTTIADKFIARLNQSKMTKVPQSLPDIQQYITVGKKLNVEVFHGNEGKRQGVIRLMSATILSKKKCTLLLYSDESMEWMTEDRDFYNQWGVLLSEVIRLGNKIKIIHTIDRKTDELLVAIDRWMPLYMTGEIEPYYYPNYQDVIFKRTMFVVPGVAALTSSSLSEFTSSEQLYYHDPQMLDALETEFESYLGHCRPLMRIFTNAHLNDFHSILDEFEKRLGDTYLISQSPSFMTLPITILNQCIDNSQLSAIERQDILEYFDARRDAFVSNLQEHKQYEWLSLPSLDCIQAGNFHYHGPFDAFISCELPYEWTHYVAHIESVLDHLKKHKHYHVILSNQAFPSDIIIEVKKDIGVIVSKIDMPPVYIAFNHLIMINAFQNFVEKHMGNSINDPHHKSNVIHELEVWLEKIKNISI